MNMIPCKDDAARARRDRALALAGVRGGVTVDEEWNVIRVGGDVPWHEDFWERSLWDVCADACAAIRRMIRRRK